MVATDVQPSRNREPGSRSIFGIHEARLINRSTGLIPMDPLAARLPGQALCATARARLDLLERSGPLANDGSQRCNTVGDEMSARGRSME
jgi:hypothetical protein